MIENVEEKEIYRIDYTKQEMMITNFAVVLLSFILAGKTEDGNEVIDVIQFGISKNTFSHKDIISVIRKFQKGNDIVLKRLLSKLGNVQ